MMKIIKKIFKNKILNNYNKILSKIKSSMKIYMKYKKIKTLSKSKKFLNKIK